MTLRRNRATRALTSLGLAAVLTAALAGIVSAHHADVTAQIDCDGLVTFTSTAWNGPTNASRTNPDIGVWYSVDGGAFTELLNVDYFFGPDHFSFTDSIGLSGATFVTIKVRAQANWGNGTSPGDSRQATAFAPTDCVEPPPPPTPTPDPDTHPDTHRHAGRDDHHPHAGGHADTTGRVDSALRDARRQPDAAEHLSRGERSDRHPARCSGHGSAPRRHRARPGPTRPPAIALIRVALTEKAAPPRRGFLVALGRATDGGGGGIRTHGGLPHVGFQDRCIRPLCHPSTRGIVAQRRRPAEAAPSRSRPISTR